MAARDPLQCAWRRRRATCAPSGCPSPAAAGAALARAALLRGVVLLGAEAQERDARHAIRSLHRVGR